MLSIMQIMRTEPIISQFFQFFCSNVTTEIIDYRILEVYITNCMINDEKERKLTQIRKLTQSSLVDNEKLDAISKLTGRWEF